MSDLNANTRAAGTVRCAVYTRKSSEEGLDMAFNSLDAQREAGTDYIKSQKHQGWAAVSACYDDGGFSGGSTERPGLQRLLEDIRRGKVDVVVVYKVDRLSRSLADFARLMQVFDEHHVSFVSVTQQFNTTTSMGRLTLNMLLSFAQFEREVTGERIRDKIAATKRKGVWVGGQPPLGYRLPRAEYGDAAPEDRILRIVESEAKLIRAIYAGYLEQQSFAALASKLNRQGHTTKRWTSTRGNNHGGKPLSTAFIYRVLTNPLYAGQITHKRRVNGKKFVDVHPGKHEPIIKPATWDQVQASIATVERESRHRWTHTHLLKGKLRTCEDHAMSPGSVQRRVTKRCGTDDNGAERGGTRLVRYYISQKAIKYGYASCPIKTVNAGFIDDLVRGIVLDHLRSAHALDLRRHEPHERDHWVREVVGKVVLASDCVIVDVGDAAVKACVAAVKSASPANEGRRGRGDTGLEPVSPRDADAVPTCILKPEIEEVADVTRLTVPIQVRRQNGKRLMVDPNGKDLLAALTADGHPLPREQLVQAIGLGYAWRQELLKSGASIHSLALAYGFTDTRPHTLLALTQLSPAVLRAVLTGSISPRVTLMDLLRTSRHLDWGKQASSLRV